MDNTLRKNDRCIVNFPRCDYVFASTRSCFIAYGFRESRLEVDIIRSILEARGIECYEAGSNIAPGQSVFCAKICSKVISSQFCIVILNDDRDGAAKAPNANFHMEYGLILGFNKLVLPFQREDDEIPFNVSGLDTIKYNQKTFKELATQAIDHAIEATTQKTLPSSQISQQIEAFLLSKGVLLANLDSEAERQLAHLGSSCGFFLLSDFAGMRYVYLGNYSHLPVDYAVWRARKLSELLMQRFESLKLKLQMGMVNQVQFTLANFVRDEARIWIIVSGEEDRRSAISSLASSSMEIKWEVFTMNDIEIIDPLQAAASRLM